MKKKSVEVLDDDDVIDGSFTVVEVPPETDSDEGNPFDDISGEAAPEGVFDGISDDDFTEAERAHYEAIKQANLEVLSAQAAYDRANSIAKAAKKELELASLELSTLINDGPQVPDPQRELPFKDDGGDMVDPDAWKTMPIHEVLKLTKAQQDKLSEAEIRTLGRFETVRGGGDPDFPRGLRSIKGFGDKTIDAMENDVVEWLSKNVRQQEPDEDE